MDFGAVSGKANKTTQDNVGFLVVNRLNCEDVVFVAFFWAARVKENKELICTEKADAAKTANTVEPFYASGGPCREL